MTDRSSNLLPWSFHFHGSNHNLVAVRNVFKSFLAQERREAIDEEDPVLPGRGPVTKDCVYTLSR
jgi:hypothetical protein